MNKIVVYSTKDWDDLADIPLFHMSYLIHVLLPRRHFGLERVLIEKKRVLEGFSKIRSNFSDELQIVPVGSKPEGYGIPDAVRLDENPSIEYLSDIDAMLVREELRAAEREFKPDGSKNVIFIETNTTRPGYGRVVHSAPKDVNHDFIFHDNETNKYYLSSSGIIKGQLDMLGEGPRDKLQYVQQGPAISSHDKNPMTFERSKTDKMLYPQDYVFAIHCDAWPENAKSWASRKRNNGWLAQDVIESVVSGGFYVVPVAHHCSDKPDIEWRLSFAKAEQQLSEQAVTSSQRQCYIYLKILRKQVINEMTKLSSYWLKNVFLYCCEELPIRAWDDDPAGCVLYMLDVLIEFVNRGNLPSYFIPENNLIDHLSEGELKTIESILQNVRCDPISTILDFTDLRLFCFSQECLSYSTTFRSIVQLVLDEIASIEQIDIGRTIMGSFTDVQCNIASVMLGEKRNSFHYHLDFYKMFVEKYVHMPFVDFVNYMGIRLDSPFITLMFYEKCLTEVKTFPELEYLRGNMACMCFALALTHDEKSKERKMRLHQAEKLYKEVLQNNGIHFASTIDFVNFLCYNERLEDMTTLLESFIDAEKKKPSMMQNGYYPAEATTLNEQLQREVKYTGCFLASSMSFAHYFLVKTYKMSKPGKLPDVLQSFQKHCKITANYGDYELLGYSGIDTENYDLAEMAFSKAIDLNQNNLLATVNRNMCRVNRKLVKKHTTEKTVLQFLLIVAYGLESNTNEVTNLLFSN